MAGYTASFGAGWYDAWVLKLDPSGSVTWQKAYGGSDYDLAYSVQQTTDGGYIAAGDTTSFGAGGLDVWVLKLNSTGLVVWDAGSGASTQTTSATPSDSSATVSISSATPVNSSATVHNTQVTARDSNAIVTAQSGGTTTTNGDGGRTGQGIPLTIIAGGVAVAAVAVALVAAVLMMKKNKSPSKTM